MQAEVLVVWQTLRRCKAPGPDTINRILHEATSQVAGPLSQLFTLFLTMFVRSHRPGNYLMFVLYLRLETLPFLPITGLCLFKVQWKRYKKE